MRILLLSVYFFSLCLNLVAQKSIIDTSAIQNWPIIKFNSVTNDGRFISFTKSSLVGHDTIFIRATNSEWLLGLPSVATVVDFTTDSRRGVFIHSTTDSLGILDLPGVVHYIAGPISDFKLSKDREGRWLACRSKGSESKMTLVDLENNSTKIFNKVENFLFTPDGKKLIVEKREESDSLTHSVSLVDLATGYSKYICRCNEASDFVFDLTSDNLAFIAKVTYQKQLISRIKHYNNGMDTAENIVDDSILAKDGLSIRSIQKFSPRGDQLLFFVGKSNTNASLTATGPEVWSYRDEALDVQREIESTMAIVHLNENYRIVYLQKASDNGYYGINDGGNFNYAIVTSQISMSSNEFPIQNMYLVDTRDGSRRLIVKNITQKEIEFSPYGKYITWYDIADRSWSCYNIATGRVRNISKKINSSFDFDKGRVAVSVPVGMAGWMDKDEAVLVYDRNDIWKLDPNAIRFPVNLTHALGKKSKTELRVINFQRESARPIHNGDTLFIGSFDHSIRYNVFYKLLIEESAKLIKLPSTSKVYYIASNADLNGVYSTMYPQRANNSAEIIVSGMAVDAYPNFYVTKDFTQFKPLTFYEPQRQYCWYKPEAITWSLPNGKQANGILYKPNDFTPQKKYPVIFYYYEKCSDFLNAYIHPSFSDGRMNIPWFVSRGYMVFVPDIYYTIGYPGRSAAESIESAAKYLSKFSYVDSRHFGLQGHSFGGFETNYVITRTDLFAAAASSDGQSNFSSDYGAFGRPSYYEMGQGRIGETLWKRPDLYIENSPFFHADKVKTPILIMFNRSDIIAGFDQGKQWFTALKRLKKSAWMLSYKGEYHVLDSESDKLDYSLRLTQFFDHYLKGLPAPRWMSEGRFYTGNGLDIP